MTSRTTCWVLVESAGEGDEVARAEFVERYSPAVRAYLGERWKRSALVQEVDDAAQEVFVECFRAGGVLERADSDRASGFRAYLFGVVRNVARRIEERAASVGAQRGDSLDLSAIEGREERLSLVFDRTWARSILREAAERHASAAQDQRALQRVELLRLRFHDGLSVGEIAARWSADAAHLHHEYARARAEFHAALIEVVLLHHPGSRAGAEQECERLLAIVD
jgi:RNA polymerase sigma-70 factor (ECF subfamily)